MTRRKVMISSTARDLPEHRDEIRLGCERAGFEPCVMEHLPALDTDAINASLRMVDGAHVYVGVFAYRYGYVPDGHDISITEMEYDHAVKLEKPRLIFLAHKDHPIKIGDVETGPGEARLNALKDRLAKERVVTFFQSPKDLRAQVVEALSALGRKLDTATTGGDVSASAAAKLHRQTSIPVPPAVFIAHPYTLLQLRDLVGRQDELNALTDWVIKSDSASLGPRVFCVVAIGGMGKSALAWKWFNKIVPNEMKQLAGRLWWSFYESDATFENFLNQALCYVSGLSEEEVRALPWQEREARLFQHLNEKPFLFALDGLERILIAYNRMDASSLADDAYDQKTANWVAGAAGLPPSAAQSFTGEHRLRQTADPRAGAFLRKLTQIAQSRILITTRLYPYALQLPTRDPYPGSAAYFLRGLSDDDAVALWRGLNVTGPRNELVPVFNSIENHPLLVQVFAGVVANYRKAPGDFEQWKADHAQFDPASLLVDQSRARILAFALEGLSANVREALHTIVGFRMPASYATLEALLVGRGKACNSAPELDHALTELEDRGLIGWDREANRYDAHPIVRSVVWQTMGAKDQHAIYTALEAYFEPMMTPELENVEALADLTPAIERYHTLVGLGRYDDACILFRDRLDDATLYRLAAHRERISWLERLFPAGITSQPALTSDPAKFWTTNSLANSYLISGQPGRATELYLRVIEQDERVENAQLANVLANLSYALFDVGALRRAEDCARQAIALSRTWRSSLTEGYGLQSLGRLLGLTGQITLAYTALSRSRQLFIENDLFPGAIVVLIGEHFLWQEKLIYAEAWAMRAKKAAEMSRFERDVIFAELLEGQIALGSENLTHADQCLHDVLTRSRAANIVELELPALVAIAELELRRGRPADSRVRLDDVWEPAERGPYPWRLAGAYNVLATIELAEGNKPAAIDAATKAYKAARCDGPPYAYHWGLQKAKAHLAALGAPEPDMPPFDESKFEPLPDVEINPKDEYWVDPDKLD
ncbi:MAG: hypothetical protein QOH32_797 [Bradyrhizobium sp.]|jgi:tetratricopeptide (TPR) repeat protein|nr:hypothetical protein [Bradyrhizobium sp.]